jgi:hypothetical protein
MQICTTAGGSNEVDFLVKSLLSALSDSVAGIKKTIGCQTRLPRDVDDVLAKALLNGRKFGDSGLLYYRHIVKVHTRSSIRRDPAHIYAINAPVSATHHLSTRWRCVTAFNVAHTKG